MRRFLPFLICLSPLLAEDIAIPGLEKPVEILRDKWGTPHIYAQTTNDLFFAQGWITAKDRLFQIDLWRRVGTGKLAEVLGPSAIARDRIARLVRFRGDWEQEWQSYSPDTKQIATAFTSGINAYIKSLGGKRPIEFRLAGYDPGFWAPEDIAARIAGLLMIRNVTREVQRAQDITRFGLETVQKLMPPDPDIKIEIPKDLDLNGITPALLKDYNEAIGAVKFPEATDISMIGSNNWVVSGAMTASGKPLLANDPHRPINLPSLRKTVHLVGPGWNVIGSGEPALPGIALGHNEEIGFGFTIVGIDQGDLYVEKTNPMNPNEYQYKGEWKKMEVSEEELVVKGSRKPHKIELRYTIHGPVVAEDLGRHRVFALKWVGSEPGSAGYLAALRVSRAKNWDEFQQAAALYKVPSENIVYTDRGGNIGWIASGWSPIRKNWSGLLPVPGHTGEYEWAGYLPASENPRKYNPAEGYVATANHNILPKNYPHQLAYEWAAPFRFGRIDEMLKEGKKFTIADFEAMQHDAHSLPARQLQGIVRKWNPTAEELTTREGDLVKQFLAWDTELRVDSSEALLYEVWSTKLPAFVYGKELGARVDLFIMLRDLAQKPNGKALLEALRAAVAELDVKYGTDTKAWQWGKLHTVTFKHPIDRKDFHLGPVARPGDGNTVLSTGGTNFKQMTGASYREIIDPSNWDNSVWTNVPGESGDPSSPYYSNLLKDWASGKYHPMPYSRAAVEAATAEKLRLVPAQ